jgi:hypothetical protein
MKKIGRAKARLNQRACDLTAPFQLVCYPVQAARQDCAAEAARLR